MDIYRERKLLGEKLVPNILKAINYDVEHTVFSFIPQHGRSRLLWDASGTGRLSQRGEGAADSCHGHNPSHDELEHILSRRIRSEKVAIKDIKLRTFIAEG